MKLYINKIFFVLFVFICCNVSLAQTDSLKYNIDENSDSPLFLDTPNNITTEVEYDPINNEYILIKKAGNLVLERMALTFEEYQNYDLDQMINNYWKSRSATAKISTSSNDGMLGSLIPQLKVNSELFETIFGGQTIDIRPSGNVELKMGVVNNRNENLALSEKD